MLKKINVYIIEIQTHFLSWGNIRYKPVCTEVSYTDITRNHLVVRVCVTSFGCQVDRQKEEEVEQSEAGQQSADWRPEDEPVQQQV